MMSLYQQTLVLLILSHFLHFSDATNYTKFNSSASCVLSNTALDSYFRDGDVILGAVVTLYSFTLQRKYTFTIPPIPQSCLGMTLRYYRHVLAIIYATEEINRSNVLLPNITLGFEIFDSCAYESKALESTMQLLTGVQRNVPNYKCTKRGTLAGIIGHLVSSSTKSMARLSGIYRYPQVSYGAQDPDLSDTSMFPSLLRTVPNERIQYDGFIQLLKHFGWTWVGIIASDDENNIKTSNDVKNQLLKSGICIAFYEIILSSLLSTMETAVQTTARSSANVIFIFCGLTTFLNVMYSIQRASMPGRVWIIPATLSVATQGAYLSALNGSLMFAIHRGDIPGLKEFIYSGNPLTLPDNIFTAEVWRDFFLCLPANESTFRKKFGSTGNCTGNETLTKYEAVFDVNNFRLTYAIYRATYALAYGVHDMFFSKNNQQPDYRSAFQPSKLNQYLRNIHFKSTSGENFYFDNGETRSQYDIMNWIITPNKTIQYTQIGSYIDFAPSGQQLIINDKLIQWNQKFKEVPRSVCSEACLPGYRKALRKLQQKCCYDCIACSEGEISNSTDMENCIKCAESQWSNEKRDKCISRTIDFLSYEDVLGILLSFFTILLSVAAVGVLAIFIKHKDTPIVKANNRNLSYILLLSLTLSFLCALLFIGRPNNIICFFQQAAFGISFAIAVSSVLAKTLTVVIAFNATKPGSESRKWIRSRVTTYLVFICSLGEVIICFIWFLCNPPFPYFDTSERSVNMTFQCNQGSVVAFYCLVGYMGILASLSFIIAFLARKLPDCFNEATHITFSMFIFCSVWLSFFPAYLSTKGKYMVAVEIFAILASSTGLLSCIFLPKCYIIMIRPDLNTKERLIGKKSSRYNIDCS